MPANTDIVSIILATAPYTAGLILCIWFLQIRINSLEARITELITKNNELVQQLINKNAHIGTDTAGTIKNNSA